VTLNARVLLDMVLPAPVLLLPPPLPLPPQPADTRATHSASPGKSFLDVCCFIIDSCRKI
jgi:hypothetical protein